MSTPSGDGRERLITTARGLFAVHGIDGVSLRQIARSAGHRNTNAVQYHFGDRDELLAAVLAPFHTVVADERARRLDALAPFRPVVSAEPAARASTPELDAFLRDLAAALVLPSAAMLADDGGRDYLRIIAGLIRDPAWVRARGVPGDAGLVRWDRTARDVMPDATLPLHRRFSAMQVCFNELGRRAEATRRRDHRLFVSDLVDLVGAILTAPVSAATLELLAERDDPGPLSS